MYIEAITVSSGYADFLAVTLDGLLRLADSLVVVTTPDDLATQALARESYRTIVARPPASREGVFMKGWLQNEGRRFLSCRDWVLLIDADILVSTELCNEVRSGGLWPTALYGTRRVIYQTESLFSARWLGVEEVEAVGYGYFQLFHPSSKGLHLETRWLSDDHLSAGKVDEWFRNRWKDVRGLKTSVAHLGEPWTNWCGRRTRRWRRAGMPAELVRPASFRSGGISRREDS